MSKEIKCSNSNKGDETGPPRARDGGEPGQRVEGARAGRANEQAQQVQ